MSATNPTPSRAETLRTQNNARQASLKARRIAAGLKPVTNLWAAPDDVRLIREFAAKLAEARKPKV